MLGVTVDNLAQGGADTLWAAIAKLDPGLQIAFLILLMMIGLLVWFCRYLLKESKENRIADRAKDEVNQQIHRETLVALSVIKERLAK